MRKASSTKPPRPRPRPRQRRQPRPATTTIEAKETTRATSSANSQGNEPWSNQAYTTVSTLNCSFLPRFLSCPTLAGRTLLSTSSRHYPNLISPKADKRPTLGEERGKGCRTYASRGAWSREGRAGGRTETMSSPKLPPLLQYISITTSQSIQLHSCEIHVQPSLTCISSSF